MSSYDVQVMFEYLSKSKYIVAAVCSRIKARNTWRNWEDRTLVI